MYLTPMQAAETFGLSRRTIFRRIKDGVLPSVKVGGARLIPANALDAMLDAHTPKKATR